MVIFISGSINSGKTTIAKLLKNDIPECAHIEIDDLRAIIEWMPLSSSIPINLDNTVSLINNFQKRKINCVVTYPLSKYDYEYILENLDVKKSIYFFSLNTGYNIVLTNRGNRILTENEKGKIEVQYLSKINNPGFGITIDNSLQSPEETVKEIISYLKL